MLTADLLLYTRRKGRIHPRLLDPGDAYLLDGAGALVQLAEAHLGKRRGDLEPLLRGFPLKGPHPKTAAGLAKLLLQRCRFEVGWASPGGSDAPIDPVAPRGASPMQPSGASPGPMDPGGAGPGPEGGNVEAANPLALRHRLFDLSAKAWQEGSWRGEPAPRESWLRQAGAPSGLGAAETEAGMFGDLAENQRLAAVEPVTPEALLFRYNTAQVQGLLSHAERVTIEARWPPPARLRQLFRYLKFFGLLYREAPGPADALALVVDGPLAVLEGGARHGRNLANFFPALLLWPQDWTLSAEIRPPRKGLRAGPGGPVRTDLLELRPDPRLRSHYPDQGQWVTDEHQKFVADFNRRAKGPWRAAAAEALLSLPGNRVLTPDFQFEAASGSKIVYLEHLPHPAPERAAARLAQAAAAGRDDYLLACRGTPAVRERLAENPRAVLFRRALLPSLVLEALKAFE